MYLMLLSSGRFIVGAIIYFVRELNGVFAEYPDLCEDCTMPSIFICEACWLGVCTEHSFDGKICVLDKA